MNESFDPAAPEGGPEPSRGGEPPPPSDAEAQDAEPPFDFAPVALRYRYDGWTPDKQLEFNERLADCGCVEEAARSVGMSRATAYALRRRPDAQAFRLAWDAALDTAVARLNDAALSRAINGVAVPIFHGGVEVGERRHFDERLTMFLLRYRDPTRYGKWRDRSEWYHASEGPVANLGHRIGRMVHAAWAAFNAALDGFTAPEPEREELDGLPDWVRDKQGRV
jgi:hypothetical protein